MLHKLVRFYLKCMLISNALFLLALAQRISYLNKKDACIDYPSCKLISAQAFEQYCSRSTLKNMCPSQCDKKCKSSPIQSARSDGNLLNTPDQATTASTKSLEEQIKSEIREKLLSLHRSTKRTSRPRNNTNIETTSTSTTTTTRTTATPSTTSEEATSTAENLSASSSSTANPKIAKMERPSSSSNNVTPFLPNDVDSSTKLPANLMNTTIFVPLFEAGFVQRLVPSSSKKEFNFARATICKQISTCDQKSVWVPETNEVPREQVEILFNYTTDVYKFEIQGNVFTNDTVTSFLFQYLNEVGGALTNFFYRTQSKSSSKINRFVFKPALRTKYIRIIPIDYERSIAMRFEVYSRGVLYSPGFVKNKN